MSPGFYPLCRAPSNREVGHNEKRSLASGLGIRLPTRGLSGGGGGGRWEGEGIGRGRLSSIVGVVDNASSRKVTYLERQ